jgi:hypothetical protein
MNAEIKAGSFQFLSGNIGVAYTFSKNSDYWLVGEPTLFKYFSYFSFSFAMFIHSPFLSSTPLF